MIEVKKETRDATYIVLVNLTIRELRDRVGVDGNRDGLASLVEGRRTSHAFLGNIVLHSYISTLEGIEQALLVLIIEIFQCRPKIWIFWVDSGRYGRAAWRRLGLATGRRLSLATGRRLGLATGRRLSLATGRRLSLATGRRLSLATGSRLGLAAGSRPGLPLEEDIVFKMCW